MSNSVLSFDQFTEKVVVRNKLVNQARLDECRRINELRADLNLLEVLMHSNLISTGHSEVMKKKYREYEAKLKPSPKPAAQQETIPVQTVQNSFPETEHRQRVDQSSQGTVAEDVEKDSLASGRDGEEAKEQRTPKSHSAQIKSASSVHSHSEELSILLRQARQHAATDLFINVSSPPVIRKNGRLEPLAEKRLSAAETEAVLFGVLTEEQQQKLYQEQVLEPCLVIDGQRYRACFVHQQTGWDGSFRVIPDNIPEFEELGLPLEVAQLAEYREGLVLITGPGGAGKSTTLASFVNLLNQSRDEHIITLEAPIEYVFRSAESHISQRQVGLHTQSYSQALRAALREDPDIIVVGELRDRETVSLAVSAAETGHLVFATLHTTSAAQTVHRLLDLFPPAQRNQIKTQISESLKGIVCQRLIPGLEGGELCLASEVMFNISSIANLIREDKIFQIPNVIQINHTRGMRLLDESISTLLKEGRISQQEALLFANNKKMIERVVIPEEKEMMQESVDAEN